MGITEIIMEKVLAAKEKTRRIVDTEIRREITIDPLEYKGDYDIITKKDYCIQNNSDCIICSLVNYSQDCQNNPI